MALRINLIYQDNGAGLPHSARIISEALSGTGAVLSRHPGYLQKPMLGRVAKTLQRLRGRPRYDINILLEAVCPWSMALASRNLLLPNQEWFDPSSTRYLSRFDRVLCKTRDAERIFGSAGARVEFVGFSTRDQRLEGVRRTEGALHVAGQSIQKGTASVIRAWQRHPEWPTLTVVQRHQPGHEPLWHPPLPNVTYHTERLSDARIRELQNSHWLHVGPSLAEGFGHWIGEAMSCGAVVITTDAPPMNELVGPEHGFLVRARATGPQGVAMLYQVDQEALEDTIARALALPEPERQRLGRNARTWFERNDREFRNRFARAVIDSA